ncbi:hypothetical protein lerEdw1_018657 [Lerista edwardsae]|nr:hypothetical protein lerEdw1_018657 [Lerista edwardsae]
MERPDGAGRKRQISTLFAGVLLAMEFALGALEETCNCSTAIDFRELRDDTRAPKVCCLNSTEIGPLDWSIFGKVADLRELCLSNCGVSDLINTDDGSSTLEILRLDHNQLSRLPDNFLRHAPSLRVIHLENNQLQKLPKSFLKTSDQMQKIHLDFNNLSSLPSGIFKPSLVTLSLSNNSWDCTCSLFGDLEKYLLAPFYVEMWLSWFWLPGAFADRRKRLAMLSMVGRNATWPLWRGMVPRGQGGHHSYIPCELPIASAAQSEKNILLQNQVLLKASTALLGSNRDLYEEVEINLKTSDDSLVQATEALDQEVSGSPKLAVAEEHFIGGESEVETVSVTDVLKDSADREKLYMNQSVDYYNLVPGIELEDSDHMEYESVDLR